MWIFFKSHLSNPHSIETVKEVSTLTYFTQSTFSLCLIFGPTPNSCHPSYSCSSKLLLRATIKEKQKELSAANSFLDLALSYFNPEFCPNVLLSHRGIMSNPQHPIAIQYWWTRVPRLQTWFTTNALTPTRRPLSPFFSRAHLCMRFNQAKLVLSWIPSFINPMTLQWNYFSKSPPKNNLFIFPLSSSHFVTLLSMLQSQQLLNVNSSWPGLLLLIQYLG